MSLIVALGEPQFVSSRREFLASLSGYSGLAIAGSAVVGTVATTGCLGSVRLPETGVLTYKGVRVGWSVDGTTTLADLCWVWSDGERRLYGWYPAEYPAIVPTLSEVVVTDGLERRLQRDFEQVEYHLGFTRPTNTGRELRSTDWFVALASRRDFNRVQFGDSADVRFGNSHVTVYRVREDAVGPVDSWDRTVRPMDFSAAFAHAGVPIA